MIKIIYYYIQDLESLEILDLESDKVIDLNLNINCRNIIKNYYKQIYNIPTNIDLFFQYIMKTHDIPIIKEYYKELKNKQIIIISDSIIIKVENLINEKLYNH